MTCTSCRPHLIMLLMNIHFIIDCSIGFRRCNFHMVFLNRYISSTCSCTKPHTNHICSLWEQNDPTSHNLTRQNIDATPLPIFHSMCHSNFTQLLSSILLYHHYHPPVRYLTPHITRYHCHSHQTLNHYHQTMPRRNQHRYNRAAHPMLISPPRDLRGLHRLSYLCAQRRPMKKWTESRFAQCGG
jgi:hypothetical protein